MRTDFKADPFVNLWSDVRTASRVTVYFEFEVVDEQGCRSGDEREPLAIYEALWLCASSGHRG
ncbi:MAG: hypothetical protein ACLTGA_11940 [Roseburia sp.]